jgi:hypothetical protein
MRRLIATSMVLAFAMGGLGCSFIKRSKTKYRDDTTALLQTNSSSLKACYDGVLQSESSAAGTVVVKFKLKDETGKIFDVAVDEAKSTAPKAVQDCVVQTVSGLAIEPPDAAEGHATYTYEFEIAPQKTADPTSSDFKTDDDPAS